MLHHNCFLRDLHGRPALIKKVVVNKAVQHAPLDQSVVASASCTTFIMHALCQRAPIDPWLLPRLCLAKITPGSSLLNCLYSLSIATSYAPIRLKVLHLKLEPMKFL